MKVALFIWTCDTLSELYNETEHISYNTSPYPVQSEGQVVIFWQTKSALYSWKENQL